MFKMTDKQLAEKIEGIKINFDRKIYSDNEMFWVDLKEEIKKLVEEVEDSLLQEFEDCISAELLIDVEKFLDLKDTVESKWD